MWLRMRRGAARALLSPQQAALLPMRAAVLQMCRQWAAGRARAAAGGVRRRFSCAPRLNAAGARRVRAACPFF
jgi:drug/metabolite transporter superfamily protein YnfA